MRGTITYTAFLISLLYSFKNKTTGCTPEQALFLAKEYQIEPFADGDAQAIEHEFIFLAYENYLSFNEEDGSYHLCDFETLRVVMPERVVFKELGLPWLPMY